MHLQKLHLVNFKNFRDATLEASPGVNCFLGDNGSGKTNLLDALHYLSLCKSAFNSIDSQNILHGEEMFIIQGMFERNQSQEIVYCGFRRNEKKKFRLNQKEYQRLADHVGAFPVVLISPEDSIIISGGSEERRKLIDSIIAQYDKSYLEALISYNKILLQRNTLLKNAGGPDRSLLDVMDSQLAPLGDEIHSRRMQFIEEFVPVFSRYFDFLTNKKEEAGIRYESPLGSASFKDLLIQSRERDLLMQYTTTGIHKDDLQFRINGYPARRFGSQGQQKSCLTAVKLAQFEFISQIKKMKPILLLDDIFDRLDDHRVAKLMELVSGDAFGQIFITDSHPERAATILRSIQVDPELFFVDNGRVKQGAAS